MSTAQRRHRRDLLAQMGCAEGPWKATSLMCWAMLFCIRGGKRYTMQRATVTGPARVSCESVIGGPPGRSFGGFSRICFDTRCSAVCSDVASPTILR